MLIEVLGYQYGAVSYTLQAARFSATPINIAVVGKVEGHPESTHFFDTIDDSAHNT